MFKYGKWEIEIDEDKTKEYYASMPVKNNQPNRNFRKNIDRLSNEEHEFFDSLCVDLSKLDFDGSLVVSTYLKKKLYWSCSADIIVFGKIISAPEDNVITIEDVAEKGIDILYDRETSVGRFEFWINNTDDSESEVDCPKGALLIYVNSSELDWLLDEKCEEKETKGVSVFERLKWILNDIFIGKIEEKKERRKTTDSIIEYFGKLGIDLDPLSKKEMLEYKKEWVGNYTDDPETASWSLPSKKYHNLLWHVFSFEEGKAIEGEDAQSQYDKIKSGKVVIYIDDIDTAFKAQNIDSLTSDAIEEMNYYMDIVITAEDFSWTFCRTHETGRHGPYFYQKAD